jgi:PAS domain S-box-containing protein
MPKKIARWWLTISNSLFNNKWINQIFFIFIFLPLVLLAYLSYQWVHNDITKELYGRKQSVVRLSATVIKERLDRLIDIGISLATRVQFRELIRQGKWDNAIAILNEIPQHFTFIDYIFLAHPDGTHMASIPPLPEARGQNFAYRDWYKGVIKTKKPYVSEVYKRVAAPRYNVVAVAIPIMSSTAKNQNELIGILGIQIRMDRFFDWSKEIKTEEEEHIYFIDHKGHLVTNPEVPTTTIATNYSNYHPVQEILRKRNGVEIVNDKVTQEEMFIVYGSVPTYGWGVFSSQPVRIAFRELHAADRFLFITYGMMFLGSLLFNSLFVFVIRQRQQNIIVQQNEKRFRTLIQYSSDAIALIDNTGNLLYASPSTEQLLGYTQEEFIGKNGFSLVHQDDLDRTQKVLQQLLTYPQEIVTVEYRMLHKDGRWIWMEAIARNVLDDPTIQGIIVNYRDITERKHIEQLKSDFISLVSHQLKTPVAILRGYIDNMLAGLTGKLNPKQQEYLLLMQEVAARNYHLISNLLNVSRLERGVISVNLQTISVGQIIDIAISSYKPFAEKKGLMIDTTGVSQELKIIADKEKLTHVVGNIIHNAINYTEKGSIIVKTKEVGEFVHIEIIDTGVGMTEDKLKTLFTKNQVMSGGASTLTGIGVGLYIAKQFMILQHGDVLVTSKIRKGTNFTLIIPKNPVE